MTVAKTKEIAFEEKQIDVDPNKPGESSKNIDFE